MSKFWESKLKECKVDIKVLLQNCWVGTPNCILPPSPDFVCNLHPGLHHTGRVCLNSSKVYLSGYISTLWANIVLPYFVIEPKSGVPRGNHTWQVRLSRSPNLLYIGIYICSYVPRASIWVYGDNIALHPILFLIMTGLIQEICA